MFRVPGDAAPWLLHRAGLLVGQDQEHLRDPPYVPYVTQDVVVVLA